MKVSNVPKKPTFTLGPSAAAGKRSNTAVISNKGLKRLKSSNDVPRPFAFAPIRPSSAANKLQGVDAEIIDISG